MSETTTTTAPAIEASATETTTATVVAPDVTALESEVAKWKDLARKNEDRSKANAAAAKELEQLKQQSMTDLEKAVAQARIEARAEAIKEAAGKLAAAEIRAVAANRFDDDQLAALLEGVNLTAFVDEDGEVDAAKVAKFVDGIAPKQDDTATSIKVPDLGQGARGSASGSMALNGDPILSAVKSKLGIR